MQHINTTLNLEKPEHEIKQDIKYVLIDRLHLLIYTLPWVENYLSKCSMLKTRLQLWPNRWLEASQTSVSSINEHSYGS